MGADHRGLHIAVAQQLLNCADVGSPLQQVCGERMAEGVAGGWFADFRRLHGSSHSPLDQARIQVVPPLQSLPGIPPTAALGKQPLPGPFPRCISIVPQSVLIARHCPAGVVHHLLVIDWVSAH